jgi:hypothetical protein
MKKNAMRGPRNFAILTVVVGLVVGLAPAPEAEAGWPKRKKNELENRIPFQPSGEWEAYYKDEDGHAFELLQPVESNDDGDWMTLEFTDFTGNRSRIAIWKVIDEIGMHSTESNRLGYWQWISRSSVAPLQAIEEMLTSAIFNTNRFDVIERKQLEALMAEQEFDATDRVTTESAAELGRILGADYILFASVNEWTPKKKTRGTIGLGKSVAEVAVSVRVVDTETTKIIHADTFRATSRNRSIRLPFFGQRDIAPVNYAMTACLNKAAYDLATSLKVRPWKGAVVDVSGDMVVLNGGENRGLERGQVFRAMRKGKKMINPEDGTVLGYMQEVIGTMKVTTVQEKMATAVITEGCEGLKVGDFVQAADDEDEAGDAP